MLYFHFDEKFPFQREQPFNFHQNDYKAHLLSLTSQFDKVHYIGLNISIKRAGIRQKCTAKADRSDW